MGKYTVKDLSFWKITFSLGLASMYIYSSMWATQPLLPEFTAYFGVSISKASMTMSATTLGVMIGLITLGLVSDRNGRVLIVKLSLLLSALPFVVMALFNSLDLMILARFIQGFAMAGVPAAALAYISEEIHPRSISVATALYISANGFGGMLGRFTTGFITEQMSWQSAFYLLAGAGGICFLIVMLSLPKSRHFETNHAPFRKDIEGFMYHLKNPALLIMFGMGLVFQVTFTGVWTFLPFHLIGSHFRLSLDEISYLYFAYGLGVIGSPIAGWLTGKLGVKMVLSVSIVTLSLGAFITLSESLFIVIVGLCIMCLGFFTAHSIAASSVSREATHHKGSASSLYLVSYYVGVMIGSTMISPLWEMIHWTGLIIIVGIVPLVYLMFLWKMKFYTNTRSWNF